MEHAFETRDPLLLIDRFIIVCVFKQLKMNLTVGLRTLPERFSDIRGPFRPNKKVKIDNLFKPQLLLHAPKRDRSEIKFVLLFFSKYS